LAIADEPSKAAHDNILVAQAVEAAIEQYAGLETLHAKCSTVQKVDAGQLKLPPREITVSSTHQYWKQGRSFRIESVYDKLETPGTDATVTFDGDQYRWFAPASRMLSVWTDRKNGITLLPPNPVLAPISFLWKYDENNPYPLPEWSDMFDEQKVADLLKSAKLISEGDTERVVEFPGGNMDGDEFVRLVYFKKDGFLPNRIVLWCPKRKQSLVDGTIEYQPIKLENGGVRQLPKKISMTMFDKQLVFANETTVIDVTDVNRLIDPMMFTIDLRLARTVFDLDQKRLATIKPTTMQLKK